MPLPKKKKRKENENDPLRKKNPLEKSNFPLENSFGKNPISPWKNHLEKIHGKTTISHWKKSFEKIQFPPWKNPLGKSNFPLEISFGKIPCNKPSVISPLENIEGQTLHEKI